MDGADTLLTGLASGDRAPADAVVPEASMKRDQDSVDDFEHLEGEGKKDDISDSPLHSARNTTQSFLDMERDVRDEFVDTPRAPSVTEKLEHIADKFTDSESDAGESPMHRPVPAKARDPETAPPTDPTPVLTPATVTIPAPSQEKKEPEPELLSDVAPIINEVKPEFKPMTSPDILLKPSESKTETISTVVESKPAPAQPASAPAPVVSVKPKPEAPRGPTAHIIEAEVIFCQMGLDAWFDPQRLHPEVEALVYWRNAARSGAALGAGLVLLIALACCSVVSVFAYCSLLALSAAVAFRIYKNVLQAVQKTNEGHPFKWLLERDVSVSAERAQALAASATAHLNAALHELRRLFLVEDLVDSLKFGVLLWCLTYLGACFNGITLVILGWIALFTLPKAYEMNKAQVDANLELARAKINEITAKVRAAVPLGRKTESDKEK